MLGPSLRTATGPDCAGSWPGEVVDGWWASTTSGAGTIVPDGATDLVWIPGRSPVVAGPDVVPRSVDLPAGTPVVGIRLRPGVASHLIDDDLDRAVGTQVPLDLVWSRPDLDRLSDDLGQIPGAAARPDLAAAALARAVRRRIPSGWQPDHLVVAAVDDLALGCPPDAGGLSQRQFRRRFRTAMGYGPTTFRRIARLDRFTDLLGTTPDRPLAELAATAGYFDQAHLNRDCRELLGVTPGELRRRR